MPTIARERPKQYACFTVEQQKVYNKLDRRMRKYIDLRGIGHNKSNAYRLCDYRGKDASQGAYVLEKRHPEARELISVLLAQKKLENMLQPEPEEQADGSDTQDKESDIEKEINALALQAGAEKLIKIAEGDDSETAKRIQFYRNIISGKIKTVRKTIKYSGTGVKLSETVEEVSDVKEKVQARKELDKILGLNQMIDLGSLKLGDITVNIVDASKVEELEDDRNTIRLDPKDVIEIDGEPVIVKEEKEERGGTVDERREVQESGK